MLFAENNAVLQIQQLFRFVHLPEAERPAAIVVETVIGEGLERVARNATSTGIGWVLVNRARAVPREAAPGAKDLPVAMVGTDQEEVGRIQARQFRALLPRGGSVLYVQGPADSVGHGCAGRGLRRRSAPDRVLNGDWTEASGEKAVVSWLRLKTSEGIRLDVVGCQNDTMAVGARGAARAPAWTGRARFIGCDGLPEGGPEARRGGARGDGGDAVEHRARAGARRPLAARGRAAAAGRSAGAALAPARGRRSAHEAGTPRREGRSGRASPRIPAAPRATVRGPRVAVGSGGAQSRSGPRKKAPASRPGGRRRPRARRHRSRPPRASQRPGRPRRAGGPGRPRSPGRGSISRPARWLWLPCERTLANTFVLFRREVEVEGEVGSARLDHGRQPLPARRQRPARAVGAGAVRPARSRPIRSTSRGWWPAQRARRRGALLRARRRHLARRQAGLPLPPGDRGAGGRGGEVVRRMPPGSALLGPVRAAGPYKRWYLRALQEEFDARLHPRGLDDCRLHARRRTGRPAHGAARLPGRPPGGRRCRYDYLHRRRRRSLPPAELRPAEVPLRPRVARARPRLAERSGGVALAPRPPVE